MKACFKILSAGSAFPLGYITRINSPGQPPLNSHVMELPRRILVGDGIIDQLGDFISGFGIKGQILVASGSNLRSSIWNIIEGSVTESGLGLIWAEVEAATMDSVRSLENKSQESKVEVIVGLGGGKSVDVAKLAANNLGLPLISVPTSASHDGISSPFASIRGSDRPYSIVAKPPVGILADVNVITNAPRRLLASGCGDLVAKLTAVKDWELARDERGEYFGGYSANLAMMSAEIVIKKSQKIARMGKEDVRDIVEALISAGVAAGIAGSSRPCSGAEHLFSHALEIKAQGQGLHGERCGLGTIMMAKLHMLDWESVIEALRNVGAPVRASSIGLGRKEVVEALCLADKIRPDRYTILDKVRLDEKSAAELATSTGVI